MGLFSKSRIEGEELRRCLDYYEAELMVTNFQTREADLFNNTLVKYFNSITEDPVAAVEVCKAANRLVQAAHEVIMRHETIQRIPDAALSMRCAWSVTFLSLKAWAEATLSAMEALANGMTPDYAYVQHLLGENQVVQRKAQEEDKRFLRRLKVAAAEINKILSRINDDAATDDWEPKPSCYNFTEAVKTPQKV